MRWCRRSTAACSASRAALCARAHRPPCLPAVRCSQHQPGIAIARASPPLNRLLAALPPAAYRRLAGGLKQIDLANGEVLYQPGTSIRHVYFPNDCLISLLVVLERDASLEVGLVGREGMVGAGVALGNPSTPVRALVQRAGGAMKCGAARFRQEIKRSPALALAVERHMYTAMATAMQIAACNSTHLLGPRLARWLLMMGDRGGSGDLRLTQALLSKMLGVRRSGVTLAASALQRRGLISYSRGRVRILNVEGLRKAACSCYEVIRKLPNGSNW